MNSVVQAGGTDREELLTRFEQAISQVARLHERYMAKAMPDEIYSSFATLRDETIPALRAALQADDDKDLADMARSRDWYRHRVDMLQQWQSRMRDPERTIVCDILANGQMLPDPNGSRYGQDHEPVGEVLAWLKRDQLAELQNCNGMSIWAESPTMYANQPAGEHEKAPPNLVAAYAAPRTGNPTSLLNQEDVFTLMGHAVILHIRGESDIPVYLFGLCERIAKLQGDAGLESRIRDVSITQGVTKK